MALGSKFLALAVGVVAFGTFSNTLGHDYTWDDRSVLIGNRDIRPAKSSLADVITHDYWGDPMDSPESHKSYRPLTILSFRIGYALHGMDPYGHHLVNVLCHCVASVLLFVLALEVSGGDAELSFGTSLLFATHPVHVEAVANLANGRAEALCAIGVFSAICCALRAGRRAVDGGGAAQARAQRTWALCAAFALFFACLSKEIGFTAVGVTLTFDALMLSRAISGPGFLRIFGIGRNRKPTPTAGKRKRGGGGSSASASASGDLLSSAGCSACAARGAPQALVIAAVLLWRALISGDGVAPHIPWRDRPGQFVASAPLRWLSNAYYSAEHLRRLVWPAALCCESSWRAVLPIGTHSPAWSDARVGLIVVSLGAVVTLGVTALAQSGVRGDLGSTLVSGADGSVKAKGKTNVKASTKQARNAAPKSVAEANAVPEADLMPAVARSRTLLMGTLLLILPFVPSTGILAVPGFAVAERVLYTPLAGFCMLVALALRLCLRRAGAPVRVSLLILLAALYGQQSRARNEVWRTNADLWRAEYETNRNCFRVLINHGVYTRLGLTYDRETGDSKYDPKLHTRENLLKAADDVMAGLELCPEDADGYENIVSYARMLFGKGDREGALKLITRMDQTMDRLWASRRKDMAWSTVCSDPKEDCGPQYPLSTELKKMIASIPK